MFDTIIIGSGPAGLSAAVYAVRAGLKFIVLEKNPMSGGQVLDTYEVDNYLGLPGINGFDMGMKFREHAEKLGATFVNDEVVSIDIIEKGDDTHAPNILVKCKNAEYNSKTIILATGASHRLLGAKGEDKLRGVGVSYCATCDGAFFKKKDVAVVGGGDVAVEDAIFLARTSNKVYLIHRRDELRAAKILQDELKSLPNVEIIWDSVVDSINGSDNVESITVRNIKTKDEINPEVSACFIAVGITPQTSLIETLVETDDNGYIIAKEDCKTSIDGIYAAGDVRKKRLRQIVTAVSDGASAVTSISDFLIGKT